MGSQIEFIVRSRTTPLKGTPRDVFVLTTDNWDDFNYQVQFHLAYIDTKGLETRIGAVKILKKSSENSGSIHVDLKTVLPSIFTELSDDYISLGQGDDYYQELFALTPLSAEKVLTALRDIALLPALANVFEPTTAFRNAMMRENGAHRARRFGRAWSQGRPVNEKLSFSYSGKIEGASQSTDIKINFSGKDPLPGRVIGIIGRNAVGKTKYLAQLGEDLAQISRASAERLESRDERFPDGRPLFTRVIAVSYSAFDRFKRPSQGATSSYVYCGIRNEKGAISQKSLIASYRNNQQRIRDRDMQSEWTDHMETILSDLGLDLRQRLAKEIEKEPSVNSALSSLSSGQSILCHFVTALMAWIQPNSLVLFDEPETHLHPNAVANLFLVLTRILEANNSYAILATHSPVVIQQIPAKRVIVFSRAGDITSAEPLGLESFGESLTELTRHVFETIDVVSPYKEVLKELAREESVDEIMKRFDRGLSISAQAYLLAQFDQQAGKKR